MRWCWWWFVIREKYYGATPSGERPFIRKFAALTSAFNSKTRKWSYSLTLRSLETNKDNKEKSIAATKPTCCVPLAVFSCPIVCRFDNFLLTVEDLQPWRRLWRTDWVGFRAKRCLKFPRWLHLSIDGSWNKTSQTLDEPRVSGDHPLHRRYGKIYFWCLESKNWIHDTK